MRRGVYNGKKTCKMFFNISIFMFVYSLNWPGDGV